MTRYNLDPSKYGFYYYIGNKKFEVYKFERRTLKGDYLIFNVKGKKIKRKIYYDRNKTPYCRLLKQKSTNIFVFKCDLRNINDLFKYYCDRYCKLADCEHDYIEKYFCDIFTCKEKNKNHFHKVCEKCFKGNIRNINSELMLSSI